VYRCFVAYVICVGKLQDKSTFWTQKDQCYFIYYLITDQDTKY